MRLQGYCWHSRASPTHEPPALPGNTACQKRLFDKLADGEAGSPRHGRSLRILLESCKFRPQNLRPQSPCTPPATMVIRVARSPLVLSLRFSSVCKGFPPVAALERGRREACQSHASQIPFWEFVLHSLLSISRCSRRNHTFDMASCLLRKLFFLSPSSTGRIRLFGECTNTRSIHLP